MPKGKEVKPQELELYIPVTIYTSTTVNLDVLTKVLNDQKLFNKIRSMVMGGLTLPRERKGQVENTECDVGPIAIGPINRTRWVRISGG